MAKGLGLDLILLVEQGVRAPGGLQGDVEYIPFDRDAPEKEFDKIIEMVAALSPKPSTSQTTSADGGARGETQQSEEPETPSGPDWMTPAPDWKQLNYVKAAFFMVLHDDEGGFDRIASAYLDSDDAKNADNCAAWHSRIELIRIESARTEI